MAIGMTYDEYWHGDPFMVRAFYKAEKLRRERLNAEMWLNGVYTLKALEATVGNLMKKKTDKSITYPEKPIEFEQKQSAAPMEKTKEQEQQEATFAKAYMMQMMQSGKEWGKR